MICFPLDNTPYEAKDMGTYLATRTRGVFSSDGNLAVTPRRKRPVRIRFPRPCLAQVVGLLGVQPPCRSRHSLSLWTPPTAHSSASTQLYAGSIR